MGCRTASGRRPTGASARSRPRASCGTGDFTFTKYWADWCKPCEAQTEILSDFLESQPETQVTLLHVEADLGTVCEDDEAANQRLYEKLPGVKTSPTP